MLADPEKFAPWLHRIVFGTCIDWLRAFRPGLYQSSAATDADLLNFDSTAPTPLDVVERADLTRRIGKALELPEKYRVPFHLYHLDGLSHDRVADALGVPVATVRSLVHRARQKLAQLLPDLRDDYASFFDAPSMPHTMLHVLNGDATRISLEQSNVPGTFSVWGDGWYEGPVPRDVSDRELIDVRARFHAGEWVSYEAALAMGMRWLTGLESHIAHDETDQLASLLDTRQRVSERQLALGHSAWRAFTGDDPTVLGRLGSFANLDVSCVRGTLAMRISPSSTSSSPCQKLNTIAAPSWRISAPSDSAPRFFPASSGRRRNKAPRSPKRWSPPPNN